MFCSFNPRTYIRYDLSFIVGIRSDRCFNPRTYIRYDGAAYAKTLAETKFQSTYLYKVRLEPYHGYPYGYGFNPRTYIRYDLRSVS